MNLELSEFNWFKVIFFCAIYGTVIGILFALALNFSGLQKPEFLPIVIGGFVGGSLPILIRKNEKWFKKNQ